LLTESLVELKMSQIFRIGFETTLILYDLSHVHIFQSVRDTTEIKSYRKLRVTSLCVDLSRLLRKCIMHSA